MRKRAYDNGDTWIDCAAQATSDAIANIASAPRHPAALHPVTCARDCLALASIEADARAVADRAAMLIELYDRTAKTARTVPVMVMDAWRHIYALLPTDDRRRFAQTCRAAARHFYSQCTHFIVPPCVPPSCVWRGQDVEWCSFSPTRLRQVTFAPSEYLLDGWTHVCGFWATRARASQTAVAVFMLDYYGPNNNGSPREQTCVLSAANVVLVSSAQNIGSTRRVNWVCAHLEPTALRTLAAPSTAHMDTFTSLQRVVLLREVAVYNIAEQLIREGVTLPGDAISQLGNGSWLKRTLARRDWIGSRALATQTYCRAFQDHERYPTLRHMIMFLTADRHPSSEDIDFLIGVLTESLPAEPPRQSLFA